GGGRRIGLLDLLRRHRGRRRIALAGRHAAGRVLETRGDSHEPDREDQRRHEHLGQRESPLRSDVRPRWTVTRPEVDTTTVRVAPSTGLVTVNEPAGLAVPRFANTTFPPELTWRVLAGRITTEPSV